MSKEEILEKVIRLLSTLTDETDISPQDELLNDLGVSSMDILMLMTMLNEELHVKISESQLRGTVTVEDIADVLLEAI